MRAITLLGAMLVALYSLAADACGTKFLATSHSACMQQPKKKQMRVVIFTTEETSSRSHTALLGVLPRAVERAGFDVLKCDSVSELAELEDAETLFICEPGDLPLIETAIHWKTGYAMIPILVDATEEEVKEGRSVYSRVLFAPGRLSQAIAVLESAASDLNVNS